MAAIATPLITGSPDSQQRRSFPRTSSFASKTATHPHQKEDDPPPAPPSSPGPGGCLLPREPFQLLFGLLPLPRSAGVSTR